MSNINTTSNRSRTNSDVSIPAEVSVPAAVQGRSVGEFAGSTVEAVKTEENRLVSPTIRSAFTSQSDLSNAAGTPLAHNIIEVNTSFSVANSSPSLTSDEESGSGKSEEKKSLLEKKLSDAESVTFSAATPGYINLNEAQSRYVDTLRRALAAMENIPVSVDESTNLKISSAVEGMVSLADDIKELTHITIAARLEGKATPAAGLVGEAGEAIEHYLDYIQDLKNGDDQKASVDSCLLKKCVSKFKALEADENNNQSLSEFYHEASYCYLEAFNERDVHEIAKGFGQKGDAFFHAAEALENNNMDASILYKQAGVCFQNRVDELYQAQKGRIAKTLTDRQRISWLEKAGNALFDAGDAIERKKQNLADLFKKGADCFERAAQTALEQTPQTWKRSQLLEQAGDHFIAATQALNGGSESLLARLEEVLGDSRKEMVNAIEIGSGQAHDRFQESYRAFSNARKGYQKGDKIYFKALAGMGMTYYKGGVAWIEGKKEIAGLYDKAISCQSSALKNSEDESDLIKASNYFIQAINMLEAGNREAAKLYDLAGDYTQKAVAAKEERAQLQLSRVASCALKIVEIKEKGFQEEDEAIRSFQSALLYNQTVAESVQLDSSRDKEALNSMERAASHLFFAATAIEQGDKKLSDMYNRNAGCFHHLAIAKKPALLECFPLRFQEGLKKEAAPNGSLITYWRNAAAASEHEIETLLQERRKNRSNVAAGQI